MCGNDDGDGDDDGQVVTILSPLHTYPHNSPMK